MAEKRKRRKRLGCDFWTKLIGEYEARPRPQVEFAAEHGVVLSTFHSWLYKLRAERRGASAVVVAPAPFVEVLAAEQQHDDGRRRVRLGAATVEFDAAPSAAYVAELLLRVTQ